jgi:aminoglycoside 6'-N-acetyltransferase I
VDGLRIRTGGRADRDAWLRLREALWPAAPGEHAAEIDRLLRDAAEAAWPQAALLAEVKGHAVGLAEVSVRPVAEGCASQRVGYLEGWYVEPACRRRGVGRALVAAFEDWARARGCRELASDTEHDNELSCRAHLALGFEDAGLVRCFRRSL